MPSKTKRNASRRSSSARMPLTALQTNHLRALIEVAGTCLDVGAVSQEWWRQNIGSIQNRIHGQTAGRGMGGESTLAEFPKAVGQ
jgi:hypothetical protein